LEIENFTKDVNFRFSDAEILQYLLLSGSVSKTIMKECSNKSTQGIHNIANVGPF